MKFFDETPGDQIRRFRIYRKVNYVLKNKSEKNPYNLPEFARSLDISPSALSQIERNIIKKPSSRIIEKASELLEIKVRDYNNVSVEGKFSNVIEELTNLVNSSKKSISNSIVNDIKKILKSYGNLSFDTDETNSQKSPTITKKVRFEEWM